MRYRFQGGTTKGALSRFDKVLAKLGHIKYIRAYRYQGRYGLNEAILVRGVNGTARFTGLCWGYGGEGPRGTYQLLIKVGVSKNLADSLAFHVERKDTIGDDWRINCQWEVQ